MLFILTFSLFVYSVPSQSFYVDPLLFPTKSEMILSANLSKSVYKLEVISRIYPVGVYFQPSKTYATIVNDTLWISYRGTYSVVDIYEDINIEKVEPFGSGNGKIHRGFYERSGKDFGIDINTNGKPKENSILDLIEKSNAKNIIFTGHSSGGTSALLSYLRYINYCENNICKYKDKSKVISFAAPVCTTEEIRQRYLDYTNNIHCFEQWDDPVPGIIRFAEVTTPKLKSEVKASKAVSIPIGIHHIWNKKENIVVPNNTYSIITYITVSERLDMHKHAMNTYICLVDKSFGGINKTCSDVYSYGISTMLLFIILTFLLLI